MLCCRTFPVAKKFMDKREGKYQDFLRIFLRHNAEKYRRGTLESFISFGYRKSLDERVGGGRECPDFPSKFSCLTVKKIFVGEHFGVSEISGSENFRASERRGL